MDIKKWKTKCDHYNEVGHCTGCNFDGKYCITKNTYIIDLKQPEEEEKNNE